VRYFLAILGATYLIIAGGLACAASIEGDIDHAIATSNYVRALELIDTGLLDDPGNTSLLFHRARVLSYVGDLDPALDTLTRLQKAYPHDVDYLLARAQILARLGRDHEALDDLRSATDLAPDYEDVWRLQYSLLLRQPGDGTKEERVAVSHQASQLFPDSSWWRVLEEEPEPVWTVLVGAGHETLSNGSPPWNRQFIEVSREHGPWGRYRAGIAHDERFNNSDNSVLLGGDVTFSERWSAGFDISHVGSPEFLPKLDYSAYVGRVLEDGWALNLRYRRREYDRATVGSVIGTAEKYQGPFRFAYTLGVSRLHGASSFMNHALTMNWYYDDRAGIGVTINTGKEAEAVAPGVVLETAVRGVSLSGRRQLTDRYGLQWWLGLHDQGDLYRRRFLGLAISIQL